MDVLLSIIGMGVGFRLVFALARIHGRRRVLSRALPTRRDPFIW